MTSDPDFILKEHLAYLSFYISETKNTEKKLYRKNHRKLIAYSLILYSTRPDFI